MASRPVLFFLRLSAAPSRHFSPAAFHPYRPYAASSLRTYATHHSSSSSSSSSAGPSSSDLDAFEARRRAQAARDAAEAFAGQRAENVGPFPLGVGPSGRGKVWRKWGELGLGGKLVRSTQQTGNLAVIVVGGTLLVILTLALTTELFAKNSPSVLYSQAVDLIRESNALDPHLLPPLKFTHTPHPSSPVRGNPPLPHTFVTHPQSGREHLLLTFWVHGRGLGEPEPWARTKGVYRSALGYGRQGLAYIGIGPDEGDTALAQQEEAKAHEAEVEDGSGGGSGWLTWAFGGFSGLRGGAGTGRETKDKKVQRGPPPAGTYKIGEVRADYVKNASGQFSLLTLAVDIPSSKASYPARALIFQSPEAAKEGLLGRIR